MKRIISISTIGVAGAVAVGVLTLQGPSAFADDAAFKRDDDAGQAAMGVDDGDDDDDTNDDTSSVDTGNSLSTNDGTNSRFTAVSRDRDLSRSDLTKDFTNDGPGTSTRDLSANSTNDGSRNDTRGPR